MASQGVKRVQVVTDKFLAGSGLLDDTKKSLAEKGIGCTVFDGCVADPTEQNVYDAVDMATQEKVDGVIGFGGGSSMDVAKVTAYLSGNKDQTLEDVWGIDVCRSNRLSLI